MTRRILLAIPDPGLAGQLAALTREGSGLEVVGTAATAEEVSASIARVDPDAVILHEELGPLPVLDLARQLAGSYPAIGFVLLAREVTPDLLHLALRAGIRDVMNEPPTLEGLQVAIEAAAGWSQTMRSRIDEDGLGAAVGQMGGRVVVVAGGKGGVGASTVALHLALAAARADGTRTVCLAELDLQAGDLRAMLDVPSSRSIADLVAVAGDLSARSLDETLYVHRSGVRVLFAPERGEDAEDVAGEAARQIIGALKFQYDVVIADVGAVLTEAGAIAVDLADQALILATPDVASLRGANRMLSLWERLQISVETSVILNRTARDQEIQPELAEKVAAAPLGAVRIPAAFRQLEPAVNTGDPDRLAPGSVRKAIEQLATELGLIAPRAVRSRLRLRAEAGQAMVETIGITWLILLVALALWQFALTGFTWVMTTDAARAGARALAVGQDGKAVAKTELPGFLDQSSSVTVDSAKTHVRVSVAVPLILPWVTVPIRVTDQEGTIIEGQAQ